MTAAEKVRRIEADEAPTRFARGWHCLGLAEGFKDGKPHTVPAFGMCGARVAVRKSSWDQTTIQRDAESTRTCVERATDSRGPESSGQFFSGCAALRQAIREAAVRGGITIQAED